MTLFVAVIVYFLIVACFLRFFRALAAIDRQVRALSSELFFPSSPGQPADNY
ncbi:MAG: hypothetical protein WB699_11520 [Bacteroidota bacterium]